MCVSQRMRKERDDFLAHEAQFTNPTWSAEPYNGEYGIETVPLHLRDVWNMCADIVWDTVEEYLATMKSVQDVVQETANLRLRWKNQRDRIFRMVGEAEVRVGAYAYAPMRWLWLCWCTQSEWVRSKSHSPTLSLPFRPPPLPCRC